MKNFCKTLAYPALAVPVMACGMLATPDNYRVAYCHYKNGNKDAVIIAPGFYNSKDATLLQKLKDSLIDSYDVIMFDFRGHGRSSGLFYWTSKEDLDLETVLDYAAKDYQRIGIIAFSLGAATSIDLLSKKDAVRSLVAISTPSDAGKIDYKFWRLDFSGDILYTFGNEGRIGRGVRPGPFWLKKVKPIDAVEKVKCPILYIHGDKDWVIGYKNSQRLFEKTKAKKEIRIIKGGPHAEYLLKDESQKVTDLIRAWLKDTLKEGG
jgi:pimeloyl-ACP methyl ester carboxylesterase